MNSMSSTSAATVFKKSRLAGFFLLLGVVACQDAPTTEQQLLSRASTDGAAAAQLARLRLAENDLTAALQWWRQAAALDAPGALEHALMLQVRLEGKLATAHWLTAQQAAGQDYTHQLQPQLLAELGLWAMPPQTEFSAAENLAGASCSLRIQPVVTSAAAERTYQLLAQQWQQDPQLSQLPVCFAAVVRVQSTLLNCSEQAASRIHCEYQQLQQLVQQGQFQQLLLLGGRGIASFNNGIIQLPEDANLALLRHEFLHIAGFLDEYALSALAARAVCQSGRIAPNLLVGADNSTLARYRQRYRVATQDIELTAVDTCQAVGLQAYRPVAAVNSMRHFEAPLPQLYFDLLQQELEQAALLMPVQYYFAYLARQQEAWQDWYQLMHTAAGFGYPPAIRALSKLNQTTTAAAAAAED
jgi:hypothetical protein